MAGELYGSQQRGIPVVGGTSAGGWPTTEATIKEQPSLSGLAAMADQVAAGVQDVFTAWTYFKYGQEMPETNRKDQISGDRIVSSYEELRAAVNNLREIAAEIRSRA